MGSGEDSALTMPARPGGHVRDAAVLAREAIAAWVAIHTVFAAVIGARGFVAVFQRSLLLSQAEHACLASLGADSDEGALFASLQIVLSEQTPSQVTVVNESLLQAFNGLLTSLLGAPLTQRLVAVAALKKPAAAAKG